MIRPCPRNLLSHLPCRLQFAIHIRNIYSRVMQWYMNVCPCGFIFFLLRNLHKTLPVTILFILFKRVHEAGYCSGNAVDFHQGEAGVESRLEHRPFWLRVFVVLSHSYQINARIVSRTGHGRFVLIYYSSSDAVSWDTDGVLKYTINMRFI